MTFKVTYGQLRDTNFGRAWGKVSGFSGYKSPAVAINIAKMNKRLLEEAKLADEQHFILASQYAVLETIVDKSGNKQSQWKFNSPEAEKEYEAKLKDFNPYTFEIPGVPIKVEDILPAGVSPLDMSFLDDFLAPVLESVK